MTRVQAVGLLLGGAPWLLTVWRGGGGLGNGWPPVRGRGEPASGLELSANHLEVLQSPEKAPTRTFFFKNQSRQVPWTAVCRTVTTPPGRTASPLRQPGSAATQSPTLGEDFTKLRYISSGNMSYVSGHKWSCEEVTLATRATCGLSTGRKPS